MLVLDLRFAELDSPCCKTGHWLALMLLGVTVQQLKTREL